MAHVDATNTNGVLNLPSPMPVGATTDRLAAAFEDAGMTIFARIDQQAAAARSGLSMRPMQLLLFGNPKAGTPLMQAHPTLAIDLPLKALVWEDERGQAWVSLNDPQYLRQRHALADAPFVPVRALVERSLV